MYIGEVHHHCSSKAVVCKKNRVAVFVLDSWFAVHVVIRFAYNV